MHFNTKKEKKEILNNKHKSSLSNPLKKSDNTLSLVKSGVINVASQVGQYKAVPP